jgi:hypothetical protein
MSSTNSTPSQGDDLLALLLELAPESRTRAPGTPTPDPTTYRVHQNPADAIAANLTDSHIDEGS